MDDIEYMDVIRDEIFLLRTVEDSEEPKKLAKMLREMREISLRVTSEPYQEGDKD